MKKEIAVSGYMIPADLKNGSDYWLVSEGSGFAFYDGGGLRHRAATMEEIDAIRKDCGSNWPFEG